MNREIFINVGATEERIALLEDGQLVELEVERPDTARTVGNVYKGKIRTVLPGMQAAFVDVGMEMSAFLHVSDVSTRMEELTAVLDVEYEEEFEGDGNGGGTAKKGGRSRNGSSRGAGRRGGERLPIEDRLSRGQDIMVQVTKEPIGTKGPRLTTQISLPGRFLVLLTADSKIGISRKISDRSERARLHKIIRNIKPKNLGVILRTECAGKDQQAIQDDLARQVQLWDEIQKKYASSPAPSCLHTEKGIATSAIRDVFGADINRLTVDNKKTYDQIRSYLKDVAPQLIERVHLYKGKEPLFDKYGIESEIKKTLDRKVWLKRGGNISIEHTEGMVCVDVNTGRYVGKKNQAETILRTNIEAAKEIARQLRLRDIGGIVVIDFIDMEDPGHQRQVMGEMRAELKRSRAKFNISDFSEFGLIELTRQRVRPSLFHTLSEVCPTCDGSGRVLSRETMTTKIERWFQRARIGTRDRKFRLEVNPVIATYLRDNEEQRLRAIRERSRLRVQVQENDELPADRFEVYSVRRKRYVTDEFTT
ncbi:ribonuclease E/G [Gemmatimonadota bacterium]